MFDDLARFIPLQEFAPALIAIALWGGANYVAIAPEYGSRMGDLTYRPQCVASVEILQHRTRAEHEAERRRLQEMAQRAKEVARQAEAEVRRQADVARGAANIVKGLISPRLRGDLDRLTGQHDFVGKALSVPDLPSEKVPQTDDIPAPLPPARAETREAFCTCVVTRVLDQSRSDLALFTGTFSLYVPDGLQDIEGRMADEAQGGACGPVPMS